MKLKAMKTPAVFLMGLLVGVMITGVVAAQTRLQVTAFLDNGISVYFNGQQKALPDDMNIIIYNNRTYTPARFIAEELGAEVGWDAVSRSVLITREEPKVPEPVECEPVPDEEDEVTPPRPPGNYQKLPQTKATGDLLISLTNIDFTDNDTWFYLDVEGRLDQNIQINQRSAVITANGVTYKHGDVRNVVNPVDTRWFNDIRRDDRVTGWIKFGPLDKDTKFITLEFEYFVNDGSNRTTKVRFEIEL